MPVRARIRVSGAKVSEEAVSVSVDLRGEVCVSESERVACKRTEPKVKDLLLL